MQADRANKCDRCPKPSAGVCCSAHGKELCHEDYRLTHFVEVCGCSECDAEGLPKILGRSQPKPAPVAEPVAPTVDDIRQRWITEDLWAQACGEHRVHDDHHVLEGLRHARQDIAALHDRLAAYERLEAAIRELHKPTPQIVEWFHDQTGKGEALCCPSCRPENPTAWRPAIGEAGIEPEGFVPQYVLSPCPTLAALPAAPEVPNA